MAAESESLRESVRLIWSEMRQFSVHLNGLVGIVRSAGGQDLGWEYFLVEVGRSYILLGTLVRVPLSEEAPELTPPELRESVADGLDSLRRARARRQTRDVVGTPSAQSLAEGEADAARWAREP